MPVPYTSPFDPAVSRIDIYSSKHACSITYMHRKNAAQDGGTNR